MSDELRASAREGLAAGQDGDARDPGQGDPDQDLMADTERFRRFASRQQDSTPEPTSTGGASGVPFRLLTLAGGLLVLAVVLWLLLFQ